MLVAWQKTEAWAAAGRLSAVAELIRRRPVTGFGDSPHRPGYHTWTTPSGRSYTSGPITYPI